MRCKECLNQNVCEEICLELEKELEAIIKLDTDLKSTEGLANREIDLKTYHDDAIESENVNHSGVITNAEGLPPCKAREHSKYKAS